jgi:hypothetical protein
MVLSLSDIPEYPVYFNWNISNFYFFSVRYSVGLYTTVTTFIEDFTAFSFF